MKGKKELQHRGTAAAGVCSPGAPRGSEQPVLYPTRIGGEVEKGRVSIDITK